MRSPRWIGIAVATTIAMLAAVPRAQADDASDDVKPKRTELAVLPIAGGSSDIGVQLGVAGVMTRFTPGYVPYDWKTDILLSASFKEGPDGLQVMQQAHEYRIDAPQVLGGRVRLQQGVFFERTVNAGYYGLGNASQAIADPATGQLGRRYQYIHQELRTRANQRITLGGPWHLLTGVTLRFVDPEAYAGSKLEEDQPLLRGLRPMVIGHTAVGMDYDTRDEEFFPTRGSFHLVSLRAGGALPGSSGVGFGSAHVMLRKYADLGAGFVLAGRLVGDFGWGTFPYYDLSQAGAFIAFDMPGGAQGVRGVPNGRYSGLVKVVGNIELRRMFWSFKLFGDRFSLGHVVFADTGRVWNDYAYDPVRDGTSIGLKYGVGGGLYVRWGTAALFRVEVAYSPDATAVNPGFPLGVYVADQTMF